MSLGSKYYHQDDSIVAAKLKTLNFDDIDTSPYGAAVVENGYGKLDWSNMYVINRETSGIDYYGNSGYITGVTSGDQAAYTGYGEPASVYIADGSFTFNSVEITSGWNKKQTVDIQGFDADGNMIYDTTVKINDKGATHVELNWTGVSEVLFTPNEGKPDPKLSGGGNHIVLDDMVVSKIKGSAAAGLDSHSVLGHGAFAASAGASHADAPAVHHDALQPINLHLA